MHRSRLRSSVEVLIVWIIALSVVGFQMYHTQIFIPYNICTDVWPTRVKKFTYYAVLQSFSCFLPIIFMAALYMLCAYKLYSMEMPGDDKRLAVKRKKQNKQIVTMFGAIVLIFFLLTTPYSVYTTVTNYYAVFDFAIYYANRNLYFQLSYALYTIAAFNSCVNPFIYAKMHHNMKKSFKKHISTWRSTSDMSKISNRSTATFQNSVYRNRAFTDVSVM